MKICVFRESARGRYGRRGLGVGVVATSVLVCTDRCINSRIDSAAGQEGTMTILRIPLRSQAVPSKSPSGRLDVL